MRLISQLTNDITGFLQKLLKFFNGTATSISFVLPSAGVFHVVFILDINYSESVKVLWGSSVYSTRLYIGITMSRYFALST